MTTSTTDLDALIRLVIHAAHRVAIDGRAAGDTGAAVTRNAVCAALECALGNGLIELVPRDRWPDWVSVDPPYVPGPLW